MDLQLGRLAKAVEGAGGIMVITADHGNSDDMFEHNKKTGAVVYKEDGTPKAKTSHSLNPVPCIIYDPEYRGEYLNKTEAGALNEGALSEGLGISSIAATCIELLGYLPPADYDQSVLRKQPAT
jgi:2,3-bisphosphoglycerate-independent phosphoglycerate mutase